MCLHLSGNKIACVFRQSSCFNMAVAGKHPDWQRLSWWTCLFQKGILVWRTIALCDHPPNQAPTTVQNGHRQSCSGDMVYIPWTVCNLQSGSPHPKGRTVTAKENPNYVATTGFPSEWYFVITGPETPPAVK